MGAGFRGSVTELSVLCMQQKVFGTKSLRTNSVVKKSTLLCLDCQHNADVVIFCYRNHYFFNLKSASIIIIIIIIIIMERTEAGLRGLCIREIDVKLDGHGRARREAARRRQSECKINFRKTKFLSQ